MAKVVSIGIQKGGVGKTTTSAILAYLLSKNERVLCLDLDSQGNLTQMLLGVGTNIYDYSENTILEAMKFGDVRPYIVKITDNLHLVPAEDLLATFSRYVYQTYRNGNNYILRDALAAVQNDYDWIICDLPPNLSDITINALSIHGDNIQYVGCVAMLQTEPFCFDALDRFIETMQLVKEKKVNPDLHLTGILCTMLDSRASIDNSIFHQAKDDYEDILFPVVIKRKTRIKEFSLTGISTSTKLDRDALEPYIAFKEELIRRVKEG